ncbi:SusC/RagA family TonB-linked outer membrane protein [Cyclobacterium marinum]|uniref:SusC/RagA family TonB-linked outer membrane protein n=1 Tax=Cyclobacterium marinum TaxID=104 RepID=UPI0011EF05FD|nr:TonB-dependent receptor [Cyclobacterium marinum]MBI0401073.1 TonB-dependent receptor [Cyclobacterium marinum]|tara:strand:- start:27117 stop:30242 length:3126 start_codon:yes stop_codon:yes gene_type:complete
MKKAFFRSLFRIINFSFIAILGLLLMVASSFANGEPINVSGTVTSSSGEQIPGVSILVKGTVIGTVTDLDGTYSLNVPSEDDILVFSSIGYLTQEVPLNGRAVIDIIMNEDIQGLDEVVVVGYGTQKKVNVIGSVTTIGNEELSAAPVSTISNALAGRLPGAIVQQSSGEPGNDQASILVRGSSTLGNNNPLIVIDGIPGRDLNSVPANNIESITVLKDASAAIYGSRAANGVILVTTKGGLKNTPATFSYEFYEGFLSPTMVPEMADAPTYAQMIREMQSYRGVDEANMSFSLEDIEKYKEGNLPWTHPNTDWFAAGLADYSRNRSHNFSVSGGGESVNYYGALGTQYDGGIYSNSASSFNRYNLTANVDVKVNEYLDVGINIIASQEKRMFPTRGAGTVFAHLIRGYPTETAIWPNGLPGPDVERGDQPLVISSFEPGYDDDRRYRSNNTLSANLKIPGVEGLTLSSYYAYDVYFKQRKLFERPFPLYHLDVGGYLAAGNTGSEDGSAFLTGIPSGQAPEPRLRDFFDNTITNTFNFKLNYDKTLNDVHNISTFISYENSEYTGQGIEAFRRYFVSDELPYLFAGGNAEKDNGGWIDIDARVNYFGRFSYNFKETYLFQFSFRRDGSLRFSEESGRWGNFPGVLAGWNASNEDFWKDNIGFIDYFKVKASWGKMGNDLVNPFQYLTSYEFDQGTVFGSSRNYNTGLNLTGTPNPFITWEVANVYNAGFESNFLDGRLSLDTEFFYERRNNILVQRSASVPNYTGISLPDENFGIVDNKGFEVILGYNDQKPKYSYGINGNLAFARNSVIEFDEPERNVPWQVQTGHPQGSALLYRSIGIFRDEEHVNSLPHVPGARPGDIIIEDYDGNGVINNDDRTLYDRTTNPQITYGLSFNFKYENWELRGLVQGAGRSMRLMYTSLQGSSGNYFQYDAEGRWTPDNINADKPRAFEREEEYWRLNFRTDYSYHNTSYARLKNLQLSYTIPTHLLEAIKVSKARLFVTGQNLFLIHSGTEIMDPELGNLNNYPIMKVFSFGTSVSF